MATRPKRLVRVEWFAAVGWPEPTNRQRTARNYTSDANAGRQLAIIEGMPSHLELLGVYECECDWQPVDPATLPRPTEEELADVE